MINFERLDAAITYAADHPDEFYMGEWYRRGPLCTTTACLAGTAAMQAGWQPVFDDVLSPITTSVVTRDGRTEHIEHVAAELLGLDEDDCTIFIASNLADVIRTRNRWARQAGIPERSWQPAAPRQVERGERG